jgi:hypothetical protein
MFTRTNFDIFFSEQNKFGYYKYYAGDHYSKVEAPLDSLAITLQKHK